LWPFIVVLGANVVVLVVWTVTEPVGWTRTVVVEDRFYRPLVTHGVCFEWEGKGKRSMNSWIFMGMLFFINITAMCFLNYESWKARTLPSLFNESFYIAVTNIIILEVFVFMIPVLVIGGSNSPTSALVVRCLVDSVVALAVLVTIFVPKISKGTQEDRRFVETLRSDDDGTPSSRSGSSRGAPRWLGAFGLNRRSQDGATASTRPYSRTTGKLR